MPNKHWILRDEDGTQVPINRILRSGGDGVEFVVKGLHPPHKPSSSGFVSGYWYEDGPCQPHNYQQYYAHVFNCTFNLEEVNSTCQQETTTRG